MKYGKHLHREDEFAGMSIYIGHVYKKVFCDLQRDSERKYYRHETEP